MTEHVRVCRDCGEEYRPEAVRCADCGGELDLRELDEDGNVVLPEGSENEPSADESGSAGPAAAPDHRVVFVTSIAAEVVPLAEALQAAQIEYHLVEEPATKESRAPRYALVVAAEDTERALRALGPLIASEDEHGELHAIETRFDKERGYVECPACGIAQPPGATECAECGLAFGAPEEGASVCSRCNAPLPEPGAACPACGRGSLG